MSKGINSRIKNRRKELNMSQAELASKVGLQPPAISQYESGARRPSFEAVRKLSFALKVSTEYLISGINNVQSEQTLDKTDLVFLKVLQTLTIQDKEKLLEFATFLAAGKKFMIDAIFETPAEYANHVLKNQTDYNTPIDVFAIADNVGLKVIEDDLEEGEGLLIQSDHPIAILDRKIMIKSRKKFTLAILLGHYLIPWHIKQSYICRKYDNSKIQRKEEIQKRDQDEIILGSSTLLTEEIEEMEAQKFATNILIPSNDLINEVNVKKIDINFLKKLAKEKYDVSLFLISNRLVELFDDKYAVIQSKNSKISKIFQGKRSLTSYNVDPRTKAATFFTHPSAREEIREGEVPASCWVLDAMDNEVIYEQSIYNPELKSVLTLLTFVNSKRG